MTASATRRFFFDTCANGILTSDANGLLLPDPEAARLEAVKALPHMAMDAAAASPSHEFAVVVRDSDGTLILRAELSIRSAWLKGA